MTTKNLFMYVSHKDIGGYLNIEFYVYHIYIIEIAIEMTECFYILTEQ